MNTTTLKNTVITVYYISLLAMVSYKAAQIVFEGSLLIGKGATVSKLKSEKALLSQQKLQLQNQVNQATTLANISQDELLSDYVAISNPIQLTLPQLAADQVALR